MSTIEEERKVQMSKKYAKKYFTHQSETTNEPRAYFLMAQPGSGESSVLNDLKGSLANKGNGAVEIDFDKIITYHPDYDALLDKNPNKVRKELREYGMDVMDDLIEYAHDNGCNVIINNNSLDNELGPGMAYTRSAIKDFKKENYKTELVALSVPDKFSKIGIHFTEQRAKINGDNFIPANQEKHDLMYGNLKSNVEASVKESLFDDLTLYSTDIENHELNEPAIQYGDKNVFLEDFNSRREIELTPSENKSIEIFSNKTKELFKYNKVEVAKINEFQKYADPLISKHVKNPLTLHEQNLVSAIGSSDIALLMSNNTNISDNFVKEVCLNKDIPQQQKLVGLNMLGVKAPLKTLNSITEESKGVTKQIKSNNTRSKEKGMGYNN